VKRRPRQHESEGGANPSDNKAISKSQLAAKAGSKSMQSETTSKVAANAFHS